MRREPPIKEVAFNLNEIYNIHLIERLQRVNSYMVENVNYPLALKEIKQGVGELNYTIKSHDETLYNQLISLLKINGVLIEQYFETENDRKLDRYAKRYLLKENAAILEENMNTLFYLYMNTLDQLNMILKKEERRRLPAEIFQS